MFFRSPIATFLLVCAFLRLAGGDLVILQVAAWSQMILTRAPVVGVAEAVTTTFDGNHPCRMCEALEHTREQDRSSSKPKSSVPESSPITAKLLLVEAAETTAPKPCLDSSSLPQHGWNLPVLHGLSAIAPPTPPPRSGAATSLV